MDYREIGSDAAAAKQQQSTTDEIEDEDVSRSMSPRDDHAEKRSELMDSYCKEMALHDQDFMPNLQKDEMSLMSEGHEQPHSRFDVDEHLEVQLRFDLGSLVDAQMILDTNGPRDSHWDFIQHEQSGLGFQASSEENVSFMSHHVKQDEVKSFDNCEGWPRSSSSQVDAQLFLDAQDDVSMITDVFGAKGRNVENRAGQDIGPHLVSYEHHDQATAWVDVSGKEQLQAKVHSDKEFDYKNCEEDRLHPHFNQDKAIQTSWFTISGNKTKADVDANEGSLNIKEYRTPTLDNPTDKILVENEPILLADTIEQTSEVEEGGSSVLQTVQDQETEESMHLKSHYKLEPPSNADQDRSEERSAISEECLAETRSPAQINVVGEAGSSEEAVLECSKALPTVAKILISNDMKIEDPEDKTCNKTSKGETEGLQQSEGEAFFKEHLHMITMTSGHVVGPCSSSGKQIEDSHDPSQEAVSSSYWVSTSSTQLPASSVVVIRTDEMATQSLPTAVEDVCAMCVSYDRNIQITESKIDEVYGTEATPEDLIGQTMTKESGQVVPNVDKVNHKWKEGKPVQEETIAFIDGIKDQEHLPPVSEEALEAQRLEGMPESVAKNSAMDRMGLDGFVSDGVRGNLADAEGLEDLTTTEVSKLAVLENPDVSDKSETSQTEKVMSRQDLDSAVELCENSAEPAGFVSDTVQECLMGAESLEGHAVTEASKLAVLKDPDHSGNLKTLQTKKEMSKQHLGSGVEVCECSAEPTGLVSGDIQECLEGADSLEGLATTKVPQLAVLENPDTSDTEDALQAEKDTSRQHLGSGSQVCGEETDTGEPTEQKQIIAEMETTPRGHNLVASVSCEHLVSDTFDEQKDASPVDELSGGNGSAGIGLQSQNSISDVQVLCTEGLDSTQRITNPDKHLVVSEGIDHASASALVQSASEQVSTTQQSENIIGAAVGDHGISNVAVQSSEHRATNLEVEGVPASESKDDVTMQDVADLLVGGLQKVSEHTKGDDATERGGAEEERHSGAAPVLNTTPFMPEQVPDVSDGQITSGTEHLGPSVTVNTSEGQNDGTLLIISNAGIDSSREIDVDMEDVQEAGLEMKNPEKELKNTDSNAEELPEATPLSNLEENINVCTGQRSTGVILGPLVHGSGEIDNWVDEHAKSGVKGIQDDRDQCVLQHINAVEAPFAEAGNDASEEAKSKVSEAPLDDDISNGIELKEHHQYVIQSGETVNEPGRLETLGEDKQASSPVASRKHHVEATGSAVKPDVFDEKGVATSDQDNNQLGGSIHVVVEVSHTETQSGHDDRQVSNALSIGPDLKNRDDCPACGVAIVDGEVALSDAVHNVSVLQKTTKDQPKEIEMLGSEAGTVYGDSQTMEKYDVTDTKAQKTSEEQVDTGHLVSTASPSTVMTSHAYEPKEKEDPKSKIVLLKEAAGEVNADEQDVAKMHTIVMQDSAEKWKPGAAIPSPELPVSKSRDLLFPKRLDNQDLDTKTKRNIGTSQAPVRSDENLEHFQNINREDVVKHRSNSALLSSSTKRVSGQTRNKAVELNEGRREAGSSDFKKVLFSDRGKKRGLTSMVQDGKSLLPTSNVLGLSQRKNTDVPVSVVQDSIVLMQASDKIERCLEVKDTQALSGAAKAGVKSLLTNNGPSIQNRVLEGKDGPSFLRAASNTGPENPQTSPKLNQPTLPVNPRQQTALPDLNVAEIVPVALPAQPFTDSQQVQLRAQILVYGSLIQGALPEEALMMAAFSDITGARWEAGRDSAGGGRTFWERSWRAAAERVQNRSLLNTPRDPAQAVGQSIGVGLSGLFSVSTTRTSEEGIRANGSSVTLGPGAASTTVDGRNIPLLNAKFPDTFGSKGQSSRPRLSAAAGTDKTGSRSNQPVLLNAPRVPATSAPIRVLPSGLSDSLATPQSSRSTHVDLQQLPARTFFPSPHLGPFVPGSTHWISPPPFPGPWITQPQQAGFDGSVPFSHTQSLVSSDVTQESTGTRKSISRGPFVPVISSIPSFSPSVTGSLPILTSPASDAGSVQRVNAVPIRSPAVDSTSRKRKKTQLEPLRMVTQSESSRMPMDMVVPASLSLSTPETVPAAGSRTTTAFSLPVWSSASHQTVSATSSPPNLPLFTSSESLAMIVASTHVSTSTLAETSRPALSTAQASIPLLTNVISVHSPISIAEHQLVPRQEHQERSMLSENLANHLEQARASAEEASSLAASAVRESEAVWSQLQVKQSSGAILDTETQLVSSAIAMATAASVAKAAAASARVAYEAALQAKAMRDEALESNKDVWVGNSSGGLSSEKFSLRPQLADEIDSNLSQTWQMPKNCKSMIAIAKQASKKRLEAVSAARMRAQNMDSVVRAAELAAAAVSQVGAIVAMGDSIPFTLDMLIGAGPEGFHRLENAVSPLLLHGKVRDNQEGSDIQNLGSHLVKEKDSESSRKSSFKKAYSVLKESCMQEEAEKDHQSTEPHSEGGLDLLKNNEHRGYREIDDASIAHTSKEAVPNELSGIGTQSSLSKKEGRLSVESEFDMHKEQEHGPPAPANKIVKDCIVEVLSDEEGLRGVWFSARVLNVDRGKVLVLYDELLSDDGPDPLEEWIDLDGAPGEAPRVRLAHPITNVSFEGTRKRRRAAMGNHKWSVGDRVDALIRDGFRWWEGEILDILEEAEGKVKVFFPGEGDTANIKTLNLRPSMVWNNGQWVLWTDIKQDNSRVFESSLTALQGETPVAKRQKTDKDQLINSSLVKEKVIEASIRETMPVLSHMEDHSHDRTVKGQRDGGHSAIDKIIRDVSRKEGSKVVFGVPKPTKKRKFIEVSKHYASNRVTRSSPEGKATGKHEGHKLSALQFHMGFTGTSNVGGAKAKKKLPSVETIQAKSSILKNEKEKPSSGFGMGLWKDTSARGGLTSGSHNWEGKLVKKKIPSVGNKAESQRPSSGNVPTTLPKEATLPKLQAPLKRAAIPVESDSIGNEKQPSHPSKGDEKDKDLGKPVTDFSEPRRSSRKIQPTSKLLEGLQSTPKLGKNASSSSHDKGSRVPPKNIMTTVKGLTSSQKQ